VFAIQLTSKIEFLVSLLNTNSSKQTSLLGFIHLCIGLKVYRHHHDLESIPEEATIDNIDAIARNRQRSSLNLRHRVSSMGQTRGDRSLTLAELTKEFVLGNSFEKPKKCNLNLMKFFEQWIVTFRVFSEM